MRIAEPDVQLEASVHFLEFRHIAAGVRRQSLGGNAGSFFIWRVKPSSASGAVQPSILHNTTKRMLRSTETPTTDRLMPPLAKSPSQCLGRRRA